MNLLKVFEKSELRSFFILALLMILCSILEALGVSIVIPVISLLLDPDVISKHDQFRILLNFLPSNIYNWQIFAVIILFVFFVFKTLFITVVYWYQFKTVLSLEARLAQNLYKKYIFTDYLESKNLKLADISNNIVRATTTFSNSVVLSALTIFSETCILFAIFGILIYFEPLGTVFVFIVLFSFGGVFYYSAKNRMEAWGSQRLQYEGLCFEDIKDGLGGLKEIKLLNCESYFCDYFAKHSNKSSRAAGQYLFVQQLPRLWLEVVAILAISLLITFMLLSGRQVNEILPIIAAFGLAALRMLPSVSKIISSITNIKFGTAATSMIVSNLSKGYEILEVSHYSKDSSAKQFFKNTLKVLNVSFSYSTRTSASISNLNFSINKGDIVGIVGESGSGKSTLLDILLGLIDPDAGSIEIDGGTLEDSNRLIWCSQIGYVAQSCYLMDKSIKENVAFGVEPDEINESDVISALNKAQLLDFINSLPMGLETQIGDNGVALSGGQRQRIGIARALYKNPQILILDEATSALDSETEELLISALSIEFYEKTIILISHRESTLRICNRILEVKNGKINEISNQNSL